MDPRASSFDALVQDCIDHYRSVTKNDDGMPLQGEAAAKKVIGSRDFTEEEAVEMLLGAVRYFTEHSEVHYYGGLLQKMLRPFLLEAMKLEMGTEYQAICDDRYEALMKDRPRWAE